MSVMSRLRTIRSWNGKLGGNASLKSRRPRVVSTMTELSPFVPERRSTMLPSPAGVVHPVAGGVVPALAGRELVDREPARPASAP